MAEEISQQIEQRIAELPQDVRDAVMSVEWEEKVHAIATKHGLHIDQTGTLGDLTLMAMLADFDLSEYPQRAAQELNLPSDKAAAVAADVNNEVFMPIRESLKRVTSKIAPTAEAAAVPPVPSASAPVPQPIPPKTELAPVDLMLEQKTVSTPPAKPSLQPQAGMPTPPPAPAAAPAAQPAMPPKPQSYSTDPYREPPTP